MSKRIIYLLYRYVADELNASEWEELGSWADQHPVNRRFLQEIGDETTLNTALQAFHEVYGQDEEASIHRMRQHIRKGTDSAENKNPLENRKRSEKKTSWIPYLAASIVLLCTTIIVYRYERHVPKEQTPSSLFGGDALPGGNRATLTLANGRKVDLSSEQGEIVIGEQVRYGNGVPVIHNQQKQIAADSNQMAISTPKGGQYRIKLPDGTMVWLNAATTLRYPQHFNEGERTVELEGEAYFEVKPIRSKQLRTPVPFLVKTHKQTVEVLGTAFNVSAYEDEESVKTTLVQGTVRVSHYTLEHKKTAIILKPGEQSSVQNGRGQVSEVDLMSFISWRKGVFYFNETQLTDAMNQLSRWYDVEIVYQGKIPNTYFYGEISRNKSLATVLEILQEGGVRFKIEKVGAKNKLLVY